VDRNQRQGQARNQDGLVREDIQGRPGDECRAVQAADPRPVADGGQQEAGDHGHGAAEDHLVGMPEDAGESRGRQGQREDIDRHSQQDREHREQPRPSEKGPKAELEERKRRRSGSFFDLEHLQGPVRGSLAAEWCHGGDWR
jgi:hypothetical protein